MFKNLWKIMFISVLMLGTLITISSNSWLGAWMGLEINLLAFIPLMNDLNNLKSSEAALKYFLTQALASSILLFAVIMSTLKFNMIFRIEMNMDFSEMIMMTSLIVKSGAAPFHFWFPEVMEGLSWVNALILMTWQKIAPLMMVSYLITKDIFMVISILSVIIGSLGGLNQTSVRKIMSFSSINHLGWMITAMYSNENLWLIYFVFYSFLSTVLVLFFNMFNVFHLNQLFSLFFSSKIIKMVLMLNLLSLGGLPPFLGFVPKWMVIQYLSLNNQFFMMTIMTMMTLITLFFYIRMTFSSFMLNYHENNWMFKPICYSKMNTLYFMSFISIFGLILITLMYYIV